MEIFLTSIASYLTGLAATSPKLVSVLAILYIVGLVLKIVIAGVKEYVKESVSLEDDKKLAELEQSQITKAIYFVIDLLIRFKKI